MNGDLLGFEIVMPALTGSPASQWSPTATFVSESAYGAIASSPIFIEPS